MKNKVLILVETPFQLLCAYEYLRKHQACISLYIRNSGVGSNDQQMSAMVRDLNLKVKKEFLVRPGNKLDYFLSVLGFLFSNFHCYDKVVLGSFFSGFQKLLSSIVLKKEIILLDDGVATLLADKIINERGGKYSVFSIFDLDEKNYLNCEVNRFDSIAGEYDCKGSEEYAVFFIGQKLVDIGAMDVAAYIRVLESAVKDSPESVVHYIPHRTESLECLEVVKEVKGLQLLHADVAVEYFMLRNKWRPRKIYSVNSTALFTLASLFPDARAVAIIPSTLKTQMFVHHDLIMESFERHKSIVINRVS
ncbi:polysialyltransferase family glycosyltransferase [Pseudomonas sp. G2-4]|uniref:polysialyltransferase family glycosyltransferase n=1 Tax=Pseudomonas sp. G2-4 TaxID=1506334 RepID=UPI0024BACA3D|nr:polysialyltransferase family glycosyltransferase [Pseudomonas sp. G2-4]WHS61998.1 polysialyltransferase family glycosyltransferase [Pseudomonas sp. G2-4]